jgi:hypothetical protein
VRLPVFVTIGTATAWLLLTSSVAGSAQEPIRLHVDDPRPVAAAVFEVEKRFGRIATYEDTSYVHPSDIIDVTEQVRRDGDMSRRVLVMRNGIIDLTFMPRSPSVDEWIGELLANIIASSKAAGNTGDFKVAPRANAFHVVPVSRKGDKGTLEPYASPLDAAITLPFRNETGAAFMERFARAVSAASARQVMLGTFPINLFMQRGVALSAQEENARDVLWRALQGIRQDLSWRLLCDVGQRGMCAINIHTIPQR